MKVAVLGALGKMGSEVVRAVQAASGLQLAVAIDPAFSDAAPLEGVACETEISAAAGCDVGNLSWCIENRVDAVVGTTGLAESDRERVAARAADAGVRIFLVPNFAIGAVLMMRFASEAAKHLPFVEITELHHDQKADAPSGTALQTARNIEAARGADAPARARESAETMPGARGADVGNQIRIHSVRLPSLIAHQEVLLSGPGELLTIRHDSMDRKGFMPGVVLATSKIKDLEPGITVGLETVL
jgi:4-hydroxy-tetrahydrodipicolinate reductase